MPDAPWTLPERVRRLCALLGVTHPILLAGMAGGPGTPELVGEVSRAGGLGVLPVTGLTPAGAAAATRAAIARADGRPVGVNAQLAPATAPTGERERIAEVLAPFRTELGLSPGLPDAAPAGAAPLALLEASVGAGASAITTFGRPEGAIALARAAGIPLLAMVTTPGDAVAAVAAGADGVIAQGTEAGGHRSTFAEPAARPEGVARQEIGTFVLVAQVAAALGPDVPVIASGGIMDGRGIAAAVALGAAGVSLGTRFLVASESGIAPCYREALPTCRADATVVTDAITGRPGRWMVNRLVAALVEADVGTLGWGAQGAIMADLRRTAGEQGRADLLPMLAGQGAALVGPSVPAAAVMAQLLSELEATAT